MDYCTLSREDFDAVVTGELTHYAIWLENEVVGIISDYFVAREKTEDFQKLLMRRDGLRFQDKIEIVRAMTPLFKKQVVADRLKSILVRVESFKAHRNAFAHGVDATPDDVSALGIHVQVVNRSGKEKVTIVTPASHEKAMADAEALRKELRQIRIDVS